MSTIVNTNFTVTATGQEYSVPGDWTAAQIVNMYSATISGLSNMDFSESVSGDTRTITFRPRTGTKG